MKVLLILALAVLAWLWFMGYVSEHDALLWGLIALAALALLKGFDWLTIKPGKR